METSDHVLVVDDDAEIRRLLGDYLRKNGYRATTVADGAAMWGALARGKIDLIVLDLMLPGQDGLSLCRKLRGESDTPVIMLTARGEETDRVVGLEMGADDYLAKPFSARELLARVKTVLRRYRALPMHLRADDASSIRFSGWTLDVRARHLVSADGVVTPLSGAEFQLLRVFLSHPGQVLSRDQLMTFAKGRESEPFERTIDLRVSRLRQRLGDDGAEPRIIKTVRGQGYVLAAPVTMER
jgi:two-component system OmpR family response regulator